MRRSNRCGCFACINLRRRSLAIDLDPRWDIGGNKTGGTKKQDNKDQGNNDQENQKKKTGNICEGEIACPPGYVVLDKPNKYGACCEPKEGFPDATPAPAPAPEPKAGACQLCDNKGNCSPAGNEAECAQRKATAEQMTVTPFLKWSCNCGGGSSGTGAGGSSGTGGGGAGAVPEDASSPAPPNNDYAKCKIPETKSFAGKGCLKGHDSSALPESKKPEYAKASRVFRYAGPCRTVAASSSVGATSEAGSSRM
ncbi:MAG: hypothetical protein ACRECX_00955 [Methyloceanibacter sp.]|uniref:hypothetical protein n=1 Tax=Methyloceanibacter sp. TaxID=1965321 RepID=UPI003D6CEB59